MTDATLFIKDLTTLVYCRNEAINVGMIMTVLKSTIITLLKTTTPTWDEKYPALGSL